MQWCIFFVVYQSNYTSQDKKRIMPDKKSKTSKIFWKSGVTITPIIQDAMLAYKNFIHWNISKILISIWSFILWIIISFPIFAVIIVVWLLDPINWSEVVVYVLSWSNEVSYQLLWGLALHPVNLAMMVLLIFTGIVLFLFWSSYWLFLKAKLSFSYLKGKRLKFRKNYYFEREHILKFIWIISWSFVYMLAPVIIWVGAIFFVYLFFNIGLFSFDVLSILVAILTFIFILAWIYLLYRIMFWYLILSDSTKKKSLHSSRYYVKKSIKITKWKSFLNFIVIYIIFILLIAPSTLLDNYLEQKGGLMRDALIYNSGLLQNLEPEQIQYYEYISREYNDLSSQELSLKINSLTTLRIILYFVSYLLVSGMFVLLISSFYKRVLLKK